jgi:CheY-like chemotaxis protein
VAQGALEADGASTAETERLPSLADSQVSGDDRADVRGDEDVLLIVDGDRQAGAAILEAARGLGLKGIVVTAGEDALRMAREYRPFAVTLGTALSDMVGWALLRQLKQDEATRHIPVLVLTSEAAHNYALTAGAAALLEESPDSGMFALEIERLRKLAHRERGEILVVESGVNSGGPLASLLDEGLAETTVAESAEEALSLLRRHPFDCVAVHNQLPDMSGVELLAAVGSDPTLSNLPFVLYAPSAVSPDERDVLRDVSKLLVVREVRALDRLLEECVIYLHLRADDLPTQQQDLLRGLHERDSTIAGKQVLIVDDDERNLFAMSTVLERHSMEVVLAGTGRDAIQLINETPDISLILLDIMMPEMDGYETLRRIRADERFRSLPIIALTAKAMKGDREKCLAAGASDYLAKPVDVDRLLSVLRLWLHR